MSVSSDYNRICLEVFGMISASVTHEIKNCLAIVNETAGLLEDLAMTAGDDGGLPVQRVNPAAASVIKQVGRADWIMRDFNMLSHSVDEPVGTVDCREMVAMLVRLSGRQAAMKNLDVQLAEGAETASVTAEIAVVESLVYLSLRTVYDGAESGDSVTIDLVRDGAAMVVQINAASLDVKRAGSDSRCPLLASQLSGSYEEEDGQVVVSFPLSLQDSGV